MVSRPRRAAVGWYCPFRPSFYIQPQEAQLIHLPRQLYDRRFLTSSSSSSNYRSVSAVAASRLVRSRGRNLCLGRSSILTPTSILAPLPSFSAPYILRNRLFSTTPSVMTATKIDGTAIAKKIRESLHAEIEQTQKTNPRYKPSLKIIQGRICLSLQSV